MPDQSSGSGSAVLDHQAQELVKDRLAEAKHYLIQLHWRDDPLIAATCADAVFDTLTAEPTTHAWVEEQAPDEFHQFTMLSAEGRHFEACELADKGFLA
jgi:hypothetical protein